MSYTMTRRSCWQLSLVSLAAADGVALMQAFGVISRLHRPSVAALLAKDLVAEWLPIRKFEQPGGVWVTHVLPAVLSFLGDSLEDVLMLPDQALPEAQSILKVCPDVQNLQLQLLCIAEQQQRHVLSRDRPEESMPTPSGTCITSGIDTISRLRLVCVCSGLGGTSM